MRASAAIFLVAASVAAFSQSAPKNLAFATKLKSVAVFRDGFGYYTREGKVKLENGWASTTVLPTAIKGSVWFYSLDKGDRIDEVLMSKDNRISFKDAADIRTELADKVGLSLIVVTKTNQKFEGELSKVLDDMLLLKVGDAYNAVPYSQVQSIDLSGYPVRIKVDTKDPNKVATLGVAYLQEGIRWEPSYVLDFSGDRATLNLRASMVNTAEKLDGTDVFFVVGSPFVANRGIADVLAELPKPAAVSPATPPTPANNPGLERPPYEPEAPAASGNPSSAASLVRDEAGELHYYAKPDLSLSTSDVAMVSIFQAPVPVSPSFEWNADQEDVAYLLNIQNDTGQPLTTGPVLVLQDGKAIGQETIRYTPSGSSAQVRLSRGIGIKAEKTEAEFHRSNAVQIGKTQYIPVTLKGVLKVTNYRKTAAKIKITRTVRGKVDELSDKGTVKDTQVLNGEPNPINDLEWTVEVAPGASKSVTYTYDTYMSAERAGSPTVPSGVGSGD